MTVREAPISTAWSGLIDRTLFSTKEHDETAVALPKQSISAANSNSTPTLLSITITKDEARSKKKKKKKQLAMMALDARCLASISTTYYLQLNLVHKENEMINARLLTAVVSRQSSVCGGLRKIMELWLYS